MDLKEIDGLTRVDFPEVIAHSDYLDSLDEGPSVRSERFDSQPEMMKPTRMKDWGRDALRFLGKQLTEVAKLVTLTLRTPRHEMKLDLTEA